MRERSPVTATRKVKVTLNLDATLVKRAKIRAIGRAQPLGTIVEQALQALLRGAAGQSFTDNGSRRALESRGGATTGIGTRRRP